MKIIMKESTESINLMKLNCELINLKNSDSYLRALRLKRLTLSHLKEHLKYYNLGIFGGAKKWVFRKFHFILHPHLVDFNIPFTERRVEDFIAEDYKYVGKGAVYSAIYGGYDSVKEPLFINENLDYYMFTDLEIPEGSVWKKVDITKYPKLEGLDDYHRAKYIKMFPYEFFPDCDFSIWVDGNVQIVADTYPLAITAKGSAIATFDHHYRNCVYTEGNVVIHDNRAPRETMKKQLDDYRRAGFPEHYGMREFSIIYRDHHDRECPEIMKEWWEQVNRYTMRDQISLPFILWRRGKTIDYIKSLGGGYWRLNPRFQHSPHDRAVTYNKKDLTRKKTWALIVGLRY